MGASKNLKCVKFIRQVQRWESKDMKFRFGLLSMIAAVTCMVVPSANATESRSVRQTVDALFDAFNRHDAKAMAALYAEDAIILTSEYCEPLHGRDAVVQTYGRMFKQVPDIRDDVTDVFVDGDKVAVRFTSSSKLPGREFQITLANFFEVKHGLIVADQTIYNVEKPCQAKPKK
jgi:uncharacterized protein (TIGR02246 family)